MMEGRSIFRCIGIGLGRRYVGIVSTDFIAGTVGEEVIEK